MKASLSESLLRREVGKEPANAYVRRLYGDKAWVDDLDIVNELGGHSGCVNALRSASLHVQLAPI
jgi:DDB1- and CUL4-associated factor 6